MELEGDYTEHPMYGQQFKAERFEVKTPKDALAMERYLASGAVKGVGAALAAVLFAAVWRMMRDKEV